MNQQRRKLARKDRPNHKRTPGGPRTYASTKDRRRNNTIPSSDSESIVPLSTPSHENLPSQSALLASESRQRSVSYHSTQYQHSLKKDLDSMPSMMTLATSPLERRTLLYQSTIETLLMLTISSVLRALGPLFLQLLGLILPHLREMSQTTVPIQATHPRMRLCVVILDAELQKE